MTALLLAFTLLAALGWLVILCSRRHDAWMDEGVCDRCGGNVPRSAFLCQNCSSIVSDSQGGWM